MTSRVIKRSIVVGGLKTSISLEDPFWIAFKNIAHVEGKMLAVLVADVDRGRENSNLSSAIRMYVLDYMIHASNENIQGFLVEAAVLPKVIPVDAAA